jgi:hypothetical protein
MKGEAKVEPLPVVVASAEAIVGAAEITAAKTARAARLTFIVVLVLSVR